MTRAVLGGSFDPVHRGHVAMARHLLARKLAEQVIVVPNWRSPHKSEPSAPPGHRLAMVKLAFRRFRRVTVDDGEIRARRPVTTIETLRRLTASEPAARWRVVIGADNVAGFGSWSEPDAILALAGVVVLPRDGVVPTTADLVAGGLVPECTLVESTFDHPVSSCEVRAMLARGKVPRRLLPSAVADYIADKGLYRPD